MDEISCVTVEPCTNSRYIKPRRIHYKQNGVDKIWDAMKVHNGWTRHLKSQNPETTSLHDSLKCGRLREGIVDSVTILVFNKTRNVFIFVKQFRPAIYINAVNIEIKDGIEFVDTSKYPGSVGVTIELCAGIIDKDLPVAEIAKMEILEECGYQVPLENIKKITSCRGGVGTSGNTVHLYYAEVTDAMKVTSGGGLADEGELIEVIDMPIDDARKIMFDESVNRVASLMFCLYWFFENIWKQSRY